MPWRGGAVEQQLSYACSLRWERRQSANPGRTPVNLCIGLCGTEALYDLTPTTAPTSVPPIFILFYGPGAILLMRSPRRRDNLTPNLLSVKRSGGGELAPSVALLPVSIGRSM